MSNDFPGVDVGVPHWRLDKYDTDPVTGEQTLIETIEGGDGLPTEVTFRKQEIDLGTD